MDAHCSGGFLYIHVSAKCKSHKRRIKRIKKNAKTWSDCVYQGGGGGGSGSPKEASL